MAVPAAGSLKEKCYQFALTLQCSLEAILQASREKKTWRERNDEEKAIYEPLKPPGTQEMHREPLLCP